MLFVFLFFSFCNERLIAASKAQGRMRAFQVLVLIYSHYLGHSYYCTRGELCPDSQLFSQHAGLPERETVFFYKCALCCGLLCTIRTDPQFPVPRVERQHHDHQRDLRVIGRHPQGGSSCMRRSRSGRTARRHVRPQSWAQLSGPSAPPRQVVLMARAQGKWC